MDEIKENPIVQDDKDLDLASKALIAVEKSELRAEEVTPVDTVERSVADFLGKAISATIESSKLSSALEDSLIADLESMTTTEKITLFNIDRSSVNDRWMKILQPTIGLITARQQAVIQAAGKEAAQQAAVQVNVGTGVGNTRDAAIANTTPPEVTSGLNTLFQLIAAKSQGLKESKDTEDS